MGVTGMKESQGMRSQIMRAAVVFGLISLAAGMPCGAAEEPPKGDAAGTAETISQMMAVPPPLIPMSGIVLMKDGITPVRDAELQFTGLLDGETRTTRSDQEGRFDFKLPIGQYNLKIQNRMDLYR